MVYIHSYNCITPLGFSLSDNVTQLLLGKSGICKYDSYANFSNIFLSKIKDQAIDEAFEQISDKNNFSRLEKMLILAIYPLFQKGIFNEKTGFILSTTKGNIRLLHMEQLPNDTQYLSALAQKIATFFQIKTQPIVISNACVSGAQALSVAKRLLQAGLYNDMLVVAGDEISEFILSGFQSFQAMSSKPCRPYDKNRDGITLGEAAAVVYLTIHKQDSKATILGDSSINDANHISGPSRTGEGLLASIQNALTQAQISPAEIDLINAHGTATLYNDEMEAIAFHRAQLQNIPLNSYKGYYGHTLGASGLLETILTIALSRKKTLLKSIGFENLGVSYPLSIITHNTEKLVRIFLKTASGFGGSNTALVIQIC